MQRMWRISDKTDGTGVNSLPECSNYQQIPKRSLGAEDGERDRVGKGGFNQFC